MATGILLGCIVVLARLAAIGRTNASKAEILAESQIICQTRLNEMLVGIMPIMSVHDQALEDEPGWKYSVEIEALEHPGLAALRVVVAQDVPEGHRAKQFALVRWVRDPHGRIATGGTSPGESIDRGDEAGGE